MSHKVHDAPGIIACPGGEEFANELVGHLKHIYIRRNEKKVKTLAGKYGKSPEEMGEILSLYDDLKTYMGGASHEKFTDARRPPCFKIETSFTRFANGEYKSEILTSIRGMDIYIIQDVENHVPLKFSSSDEKYELTVNEHFFCLLVTVDAAIQAGASSITVVIPSYPYSRQHKKKGREGVTAIKVGQILEFLGVKRIITLDIHSRDISNGFRRLHLENLHASYQILLKLSNIIDLKDPDLVVVAPDTGAVDRNKFYASSLSRPLAMLYKERDYSRISHDASDNNIVSMRLLGSVENKIVFMADDILGTGSTLITAMKLLKEMGARKVICAISIPLFTGDAVDLFEEVYRQGFFDVIIGTNAVRLGERVLSKEWYIQADVSNLFARIISRLHYNLSLSKLLDNRKVIQHLLASKSGHA
ncbi:MAG: ribose-phosphate diphosphokinase [Spirochaetales bacterium]|jgi:ribose-phosphate pyrophosphokinase|nr:ribose-phosphate diphosphokinase [Spirochaetales bacterium]